MDEKDPVFRLTIETDNAAFEDDPRPELARILRETADRLETAYGDDEGPVRDINGNTVGRWDMTDN